jgi:uncharacterized protein (DUF362 family)
MKNVKLSRKAFVRIGLLAAIAGGTTLLEKVTQPVGSVTYTRWLLRGYWKRLMHPAVVTLGGCASYSDSADLLNKLRTLWRQAEMPDVRGKRILIKPNLVDSIDNHPSTTNPTVVGAAIDLLRELGAGEIVVGDGPAFRREAWSVAQDCGLGTVVKAKQVPFVDLNFDDPQPVRARDGWLRRSPVLWLPRSVRQADYILSIPKMKTHHWAVVSLSVKNLLGVVPGSRYGWPKNMLHINGFIPSILGVYQCVPKVLALVDGIIGMEGDGPLFGSPVEHGLLAMGKDAVAVDTVCADLMGYTLENVTYLNLAGWAGIGQTQHIELRGADPNLYRRQYRKIQIP